METVGFWNLVWLLLPAGAANMAPVFAKKLNILPELATPIDRGTGFIGKNKTWRGFIVGPVVGAVVAVLGYIVYPLLNSLEFASMYGLIIGFLALLGDAVGSIIKRQLKIAPGEMFPICDQLDWILPAIAFAWLFYNLNIESVFAVIVCLALVTFFSSYIGYILKIKDKI